MGRVEDRASEQLDALVSGKRAFERHETDLPVVIKGVHREFVAVARDISIGGTLLELATEELAGHEGVLGPAEQLDLIETHFRDAFDVQFEGCQVVVETTLVRLAVRPEMPQALFLGCQFAHPLSEEMQRRLGATPADLGVAEWDEVPALDGLRLVGDPGNPAYLLIYDDTLTVSGPRFMGRFCAMGSGVLVAHVDGIRRADLVAALAGRTLKIQVMHATRVVWDTEAHLLATRFVDGPGQGAEVALLPTHPPVRRLRKLLRRRAA